MNEKYFFHDIKGKENTITQKGIAVKDTLDAAKQSYHAYLGAYAYDHDSNTDFVSVMITDTNGYIMMSECWKKEEEQVPTESV